MNVPNRRIGTAASVREMIVRVPLSEPLKTSSMLIAFAVTGIANKTSAGYKIVNLKAPISGKTG